MEQNTYSFNPNHIFIDTNVLIGAYSGDARFQKDSECLHYLCSLIGKRLYISSLSVAQLISFYMLAIYMAEIKGCISKENSVAIKKELVVLPQKIEQILNEKEHIKKIAKYYSSFKNFIYIARGINLATAFEGALKLKEISYINATGYAAGELKHGPIAMLDETMPVLSILMKGKVYEKILSNAEESKARNAKLITLTNSNDSKIDDLFDHIIRIPNVMEILSPIISVIPLQLLAYYIAEYLGKDVDQPRNLAKSVTVE